MDETITEGKISEWNEGNFKNLRLHEAQEMINLGKMNPFSMTEDKTQWNYQLWKSGIDILFDEGHAKYGDEEIKEVETIRKFIETFVREKPLFRKVTEYHIDSKKDMFIPLNINQEKIQEFLRLYEKCVKKYNDAHGLSTRNRDNMDDGL